MSSSSDTLHEPVEELSEETRNLHRAMTSLQEELEAADWYRQRADACKNEELRAILEHNMREEIEHAAMLTEWLRRNEPTFQKNLGEYLFTEAPITEVEQEAMGSADAETPADPDTTTRDGFTIGSLKEDN